MKSPQEELYRIKVLEQAFDLLDALQKAAGEPVNLPALAAALGISAQQAHRVIRNLEARGLVKRADEGGYQLGAALWPLGARALSSQGFWSEARPYLERLRAASGAALVAVLRGGRAVHVEQVRRDGIAIGTAFPPHATALGKVLLAALPAADLPAAIAESALERHTDATITEAAALRAELERVRERGYALAAGELRPGYWQAGAPVYDHTGRAIAAIGVDNRRERVLPPTDEDALVALVVEQGRGLSQKLGAEQAALLGPHELVIEERAARERGREGAPLVVPDEAAAPDDAPSRART